MTCADWSPVPYCKTHKELDGTEDRNNHANPPIEGRENRAVMQDHEQQPQGECTNHKTGKCDYEALMEQQELADREKFYPNGHLSSGDCYQHQQDDTDDCRYCMAKPSRGFAKRQRCQ